MCLVCILVAQNIYVSLVINMHDVSLLVSWKTCGFKSYVAKYKILACTNNKTKAKFLPNYTKTKL